MIYVAKAAQSEKQRFSQYRAEFKSHFHNVIKSIRLNVNKEENICLEKHATKTADLYLCFW